MILRLVFLAVLLALATACAPTPTESPTHVPNFEGACLAKEPAEEAVLMLVDGTDKLTPTDAARAQRVLDDLATDLPRHSRLVLATVNRTTPENPTILFEGCTPGSRVERGEWAGAVYRRKEFERDFKKPLAKAYATALRQPPGYPSPLIETIIALSRSPSLSARSAKRRRVIIVSDMLQAEKDYSHLQSDSEFWERFEASPLSRRFPADLTGAAVTIILLERPAYVAHQNAEHRAFWTRWFKETGAASVTFDGAPTAQPIGEPEGGRP